MNCAGTQPKQNEKKGNVYSDFSSLTLNMFRAELLISDDNGEENEHENSVLVRKTIGKTIITT